MSGLTAHELIESTFDRLHREHGFIKRDSQVQLALFLSDLIEGGSTGAVEAPTGLGKSMAALIPAIVQAILNGKRTVIATYTNVLAEQYWRKDLPLAMSLFDVDRRPDAAFLIGRQRYVCLAAMDEALPNEVDPFRMISELGSESEFRRFSRRSNAEFGKLWSRISTPPVCPARLCPAFDDCYFFKARRMAERAPIVITNHSVVIQDGLNARESEEGVGMLGDYDYLLLDEAHDFINAAQSGLEFDLSVAELNTLTGIVGRLEKSIGAIALDLGTISDIRLVCDRFRKELDDVAKRLTAYGLAQKSGGILTASPASLLDHANLARNLAAGGLSEPMEIGVQLSFSCAKFISQMQREFGRWEDFDPDKVKVAKEAVRNYLQYIQQVGGEATALFEPVGVTVSYSATIDAHVQLRSDTIGLAEPLDELIWSRRPSALISATLAVDGQFEFLRRSLGCQPTFEEILDSPFDFSSQAALYLPKEGSVPDPSRARVEGKENEYYEAIASEIRRLILAVGGRTMVLFHSRREMEAVAGLVHLPPEYPVLVQFRTGAASAGEQFKVDVRSSLFALRSFWTGFDAPGETLSCVAIVRVPFEVPIEPPALARMAHLESLGQSPFMSWTLPMAKMLIRQGAGRLIRSMDDRGVIALLDPRLRTKRYGEEILDNLPPNMRRYDDIEDAVGWIGLTS